LIAALLLALGTGQAGEATAAAPSPAVVESDAAARAAGNRKEQAYRLGLALFSRTWAAQITKVRIDAVGSHAVAGLELSGVKFHRRLGADGFAGEIAQLIERTFANSSVEEVDVWVTVPLVVGKDVVVTGDFARPTSRIVFSFTARRPAAEALRRLREGDGVYWDAPWKAGLAGG